MGWLLGPWQGLLLGLNFPESPGLLGPPTANAGAAMTAITAAVTRATARTKSTLFTVFHLLFVCALVVGFASCLENGSDGGKADRPFGRIPSRP